MNPLQEQGRPNAPAATDRFAPAQSATRPAAWQRPRPDAEIGGAAGSWPLGVLASRQAHREHRPSARLARHRHVAAHHARELAGDGKSEPGTAKVLSGRSVSLAELLEQLGLLLRR